MNLSFFRLSNEPAKLDDNWTPYKGIQYPTIVKTLTHKITVNNPQEHHELIQKLINQK